MTDKPYDQQMLELAEKWLQGTITRQEKKIFTDWYNQFNDEIYGLPEGLDALVLKEEMHNNILQRIEKDAPKPSTIRSLRPYKTLLWRAAAVLPLIAGAVMWMNNQTHNPVAVVSKTDTLTKSDISPGTNKAILTLSDGSSIVLDETKNGQVATQGNATITKLDNGKLAYNAAGPVSEITYNTLATPRGGQFQLGLPDGSKAWLNAASSIRYPTAFEGKERKVYITGEVYFEVARKADMPFVVEINEQNSIKVLGTHFNINAYEDEASIKTTLLEGAVQVNHRQKIQRISPGQQTQVSEQNNTIKLIRDADVEEAVAWKNGMFEFHSADLPAVLRQLSRWYDVNVVIADDVPQREFEGEMERTLTLNQVLKLLKKNKVNFAVKERTLVVFP